MDDTAARIRQQLVSELADWIDVGSAKYLAMLIEAMIDAKIAAANPTPPTEQPGGDRE